LAGCEKNFSLLSALKRLTVSERLKNDPSKTSLHNSARNGIFGE
jgi:hypothetical protein